MEKQLDKKYITASVIGGLTVNTLVVFVITFFLFLPFANGSSDESSLAGGTWVFIGFIILFYLVVNGAHVLKTYLFFKHFTYQIGPDAFSKKYGVLSRRTTVIPYNRIQNVDIIEPFWFRLFGLAQLQIQTAAGATNGTSPEGLLPGISVQEATHLRDEILRLAAVSHQQAVPGQPPVTPNPPQATPPHDTGL